MKSKNNYVFHNPKMNAFCEAQHYKVNEQILKLHTLWHTNYNDMDKYFTLLELMLL